MNEVWKRRCAVPFLHKTVPTGTKHTLASARKIFKEKKLTLLAKKYDTSKTKMPCQCDVCRHEYRGKHGIRLNDVTSQKLDTACKKCNTLRRVDRTRKDLCQIKEDALKRSIKIKCKGTYINNTTVLAATCLVCGHSWSTNAARLYDSDGCPPCGAKRGGEKNALSEEEARMRLSKWEIELRSRYSKGSAPITVFYKKCKHTDDERSLQQIQLAEGRCPECSPYTKVSKRKYKALAKYYGGKIIKIPGVARDAALWECAVRHQFPRSWTNINSTKTFCTVCTSSHSEQFCRAIIEELFGLPFPRTWPKGWKGVRGGPLGLDCYNENLAINLEHNGAHHYESQPNWGGKEALRLQKKNDRLKRRNCEKNNILLIEIRELHKHTTIEGVRDEIACVMQKAGRNLPEGFYEVDLTDLKVKTHTEEYFGEVKKSAKKMRIKIYGTFVTADVPMDMECLKSSCNWRKSKTPRSLLQGHGCPDCQLASMRKPVIVKKDGESEAQEFESGAAAAKMIGVSKEQVNIAARGGPKVEGYTVTRAT